MPGYNVPMTGAIRMHLPHAAQRRLKTALSKSERPRTRPSKATSKAPIRAGLFLLFSAFILAMSIQNTAAMPPMATAPATLAHPFLQPAQGVYYGHYYYYNGRYYPPYPPACPYRYHFECWNEPQGGKRCGCRPDFGLY
jgi:hypothetical protein